MYMINLLCTVQSLFSKILTVVKIKSKGMNLQRYMYTMNFIRIMNSNV